MFTFAEGIVVGAPASSGVTIDFGPVLVALLTPLAVAALVGLAALLTTKLRSRRATVAARGASRLPVGRASRQAA